MIMTFGKHRGKLIEDIPADYLLWILENCPKLSPILAAEICAQLRIGETSDRTAPAMPLNELVPVWYRRLAMEFHPDKRGSHVGMLAINRARELLLEMAGADA